MKDKLKESISALVDDESSELELRRILAQTHDEEVTSCWNRYHQQKAGLNNEQAQWADVDLLTGINGVLDSEDEGLTELSEPLESDSNDYSEEKVSRLPVRWWQGAAVAASVAFAVIVSVQYAPHSPGNTPVVVDHKVDQATVTQVAGVDRSEEIVFSEEHAERLNEYLMKHTGHAALNSGSSVLPFARLTSFEPLRETETSED